MRKLAIMAALASTALATPAVAVDNSWYVGVEGGAMIVEDANLDFFFEVIATVVGAEVNDHLCCTRPASATSSIKRLL